ncbi:hypothetical protein [Oryza sativa Japonica Group]|uniref:Uncharacterized protein n=2 Tax=Oryza sativa subsp. japonica TaxID=39947 RepID=Q5JNA7_ORYSJ|nr:hypothetical protein [Oryza sativa Japonica Group]BAD88408.1 hypothetical protein [Oryza sativa Japonica Group]
MAMEGHGGGGGGNNTMTTPASPGLPAAKWKGGRGDLHGAVACLGPDGLCQEMMTPKRRRRSYGEVNKERDRDNGERGLTTNGNASFSAADDEEEF